MTSAPTVFAVRFGAEDTPVFEELPLGFEVTTSGGRSLEGIAVVNRPLHPAPESGPGPWFYLLDERDKRAGEQVAIVYVARLAEGRLEQAAPAIAIPLDDGNRLCDLYVHEGELLALRTRKQHYRIVRLDLEAAQAVKVMGLSKEVETLVADYAERPAEHKTLSTNLEAFLITPEGDLLVVADNQDGSNLQGHTLALRVPFETE